MNIWNRMFVGEKTARKMVQLELDLIVLADSDKRITSKTRKLQAVRKAVDAFRDATGAKLIRRVLAFAIIALWILMWFSFLIIKVSTGFMADDFDIYSHWDGIADTLFGAAVEVTTEITIIVLYYFGSDHIDKVVGKFIGSSVKK